MERGSGEGEGAPGGTEAAAFERLLAALRRGEIAAPGEVAWAPLEEGDLEPWPIEGSARRAELAALGEAALARGEVASLVVAGGAGTRLGAPVKGLVPVVDDRTFLHLKLQDARRAAEAAGRAVPIAVMTSAITHAPIAAAVGGAPDVLLFQQRMLPRLTPALEPWRDAAGAPSLAPAGHGDVFRALREAAIGEALWRRGVRVLAFSNVDNLAATLDPAVVGVHLALARDLTVEVTTRRGPTGALDGGAAPVRVAGWPRLLEQVEPVQHRLISTNTLWFTLEPLLQRRLALPWRVVPKQVEGATVLQLEQVTGEVTGLLGPDGRPVLTSAYLEVPRVDPAHSRFEPVKTREDLRVVVTRLRERLAR